MLIASHRHTAKDLELWAEYEAADLAHGRSERMKRLTAEAIEQVRRFAILPCYVSLSFGKDSCVLLDLTRRAGLSIPVVHFRSPEDKYPHDADVLRALGEMDYREFVVGWPQRGAADWRKRGALAAREIGTHRRLLGIRADESGTRHISIAAVGVDTGSVCRPLGWWTTQDVFAYAATNDVPLHPSYAMLGGGRWERKFLRVSGLGGEPGRGHGRREWEMEYYGDVLRRLEASRDS